MLARAHVCVRVRVHALLYSPLHLPPPDPVLAQRGLSEYDITKEASVQGVKDSALSLGKRYGVSVQHRPPIGQVDQRKLARCVVC